MVATCAVPTLRRAAAALLARRRGGPAHLALPNQLAEGGAGVPEALMWRSFGRRAAVGALAALLRDPQAREQQVRTGTPGSGACKAASQGVCCRACTARALAVLALKHFGMVPECC